eukprot:CAMPEP_0204151408 /NCGR_PEP_ID=MMETSP0361-20130328/26128_1 /ASSEMBLY_ACC=CAM_ASM_000343 /TAXON_ID=268821 /ORGANISM="Scrippsiella Hangoei, Strain SHTV-5" /LENGTH=41 /DNA_ID= /DNA_START= /DNA_END= /DNA_ORIENTATION=
MALARGGASANPKDVTEQLGKATDDELKAMVEGLDDEQKAK